MTAAEIAARRSVLAQFQASFNAFADAYNATLTAMEPFAVDDPETVAALNEMARLMNVSSPAVTTAIVFTDAIVPSDLPAVVVTIETRQVACAAGYTGIITEERIVTTTAGVPAYGSWVETGNTCVAVSANLSNTGFETPVMQGASFQYRPLGGAWFFSGNSGIQRNSSAWGAAAAPEGQQTAFLQGTAGIQQNFFLAAGSYAVSFQAARRGGQIQPIQVAIDATPIGAPITPTDTTGSSFALYTTDTIVVGTDDIHTLHFDTTTVDDVTSFIDSVVVGAPPPPAPVSISVNPTSVQDGGTVTVTWANIAAPSAANWIALYEIGVTPAADLQLEYFYVSGTHTPDVPRASGSIPFVIPALTDPGLYALHLLTPTGYTILATCTVTVAAAPVASSGMLTYVTSVPMPTLTDTFPDPDFSRTINIGKHVSMAYCPLDQLIYMHGGDGTGWHWAGSSGNHGTVDTYNPVTRAYAESFLYRGVSGEPCPRGIDHMCWTWSPNLSKFWSGPGFAWNLTTATYPFQDVSFNVRSNYASYNTVTKKFTDVGPRQGDIGNFEGQQAGWDSTRNRLIYWWGAALRSVNPTTLEVESYWSPTGALPTSGHRTDENKGWYDADTDEYYFWEPTTGRVLALHLATNVFRLVCNTGVVMAITATRATVFIPDGKFLLIVYSTFGPNATNTAQQTEGGAFPWKLINLTTGAMQSLNLFPPNVDRFDCGAYHPPSRTVVLSGGGSSGNSNNGAWFHHFYWEEAGALPAWAPALNTVAAISGPGTDAPSTLSSVLYNTPVVGTGDGNGAAYFSAWCSGTYAPHYGALGALAFANGGDGDYWGNEGYIFDLNTRTWLRVGQRSTGLSGGTNGVDPNVDWNAWGEHTTPGGVPGPQPTIPHTYDAVEYLPPSLGGGNKGSLLLPTRTFCYALRKYRHPHRLNLETGAWSRASTTFDCLTAWNINAATPAWCYDAARGKYWGIWGDFSGIFSTSLMSYTFANGIGTPGSVSIPNILTPSRYPTSRHWPTGDLMLVIGIANGTETFIMQACPLATPTAGFTQLTLTGATIPFPHPGGSDAGGYGFAYCSDLDCFFVRTSADHRQTIWKITPPAAPYLTNNWVVTAITMAGVAVASTGQFQGMWKRFNYAPALKSLVWVDSPSGAVYAYRVA